MGHEDKKHPIQPLYVDGNGTTRFKPNKIVEFLLETCRARCGIYMNELAMMDFSQEDREQFAQLINYSLGGFSELSCVKDETYETAMRMMEGCAVGTAPDEKDARIKMLESKLQKVRESLKELVPAVFRIHPDDLVE